MTITIIQNQIDWENKCYNLSKYAEIINETKNSDVVVLPEMFTTGFSMSSQKLAEKMDGESVSWMIEVSKRNDCVITGSLTIEEDGKYYNRLLWVQPDGEIKFYDKKHLFAFGGEDKSYTSGDKRTIIEYKGWRFNLMVCYDLRFPVWSRYKNDYDVLLYVANWPTDRINAWKTLLPARAIENQCYVVGVNRTGEDPNHKYNGYSTVIDPLGEILYQMPWASDVKTISLDKEHLLNTRSKFPFSNDADQFLLN
jgi:predicted amidohydrolase